MKETYLDENGIEIETSELKHGIRQRDLLINELRASNKSNSSCYLDELKKATAEISKLKAALVKTTDENLELVEKLAQKEREIEKLNLEKLSLTANKNEFTVQTLQNSRRKLLHANYDLYLAKNELKRENKLLIRKCESIRKENTALRQSGNKLMDSTSVEIERQDRIIDVLRVENSELDDLFFSTYTKHRSLFKRQKELIRSLKRQRRYLVHIMNNYKGRLSYIIQVRSGYKLELFEEIRTRDLTILNLNAQIGEMRVKLANTVTKMKDRQIEPGSIKLIDRNLNPILEINMPAIIEYIKQRRI